MQTIHPTTEAYADLKVNGTAIRQHKSALGIGGLSVSEPLVLSPAVQMAALAAHRGLRWYEGTANPNAVARRRKANRAARHARRVHRK